MREAILAAAVSFAGSFITTSFALGTYKARFDNVESQAAKTATDLGSLRNEVTDRLARIETKLDEALGNKGN